jgi:hypothetical protein
MLSFKSKNVCLEQLKFRDQEGKKGIDLSKPLPYRSKPLPPAGICFISEKSVYTFVFALMVMHKNFKQQVHYVCKRQLFYRMDGETVQKVKRDRQRPEIARQYQ